MNSAAMRFIPTKDLDKEGYAAYAALFKPMTPRAQYKRAVFAGGCFWCMEPPFDQTKGVISVTSGYSGGKKANPTYKEVSSGGTGHYEVIEVLYDPAVVSYSQLLGVFWRQIDPLDNEGQFCDKGPHYRSGIFVSNPEERVQAEQSKAELQKSARFSKQKIVTEVMDASVFYPAEEYHQKYYQKNPIRYKYYRTSCGRDKRLEQVWGL
jgi:peptide-methionine (S)-S-oxide reductase